MKKMHPFHLVSESPWPFLSSMSAMGMMHSIIILSQYKTSIPLLICFMTTSMSSMQWWRDVFRESSMEGNHNEKIMEGLKMGVVLFIISEVLFFMSFFWAFFHSSIAPIAELGMMWPPMGIKLFNPMNIPMLNTVVLLTSGISVTWAHHNMMMKKFKESSKSLYLTIILGIYFTSLQSMEYWQAPFSMWDSVCGSTFFMATGFHGLHVIIGSIFLLVSAMQLSTLKLNGNHMVSFEAAAWYWHFVDVVWMFLYMSIYWWGN
uniref:Cytochrome c oxidase subunit 3 n=1 Tax=Sperchon placodermus TaxID=3136837 RepID=A0AAU6QDL8_9ACAR